MDYLTFTARVLDALAWPATVVVGLLVFRRSLDRLLPQLRRVKVSEVEAEFGAQMDKLKLEVERVLPGGAAPALEAASPWTERIERMVELAPGAAVLEAWKEVEGAARALIEKRGMALDLDVATPYRLIQGVLEKNGLLERPKLKVFNELRRLRNKVAHADEFDVSVERARDYVALAASLKRQLDQAAASSNGHGAGAEARS